MLLFLSTNNFLYWILSLAVESPTQIHLGECASKQRENFFIYFPSSSTSYFSHFSSRLHQQQKENWMGRRKRNRIAMVLAPDYMSSGNRQKSNCRFGGARQAILSRQQEKKGSNNSGKAERRVEGEGGIRIVLKVRNGVRLRLMKKNPPANNLPSTSNSRFNMSQNRRNFDGRPLTHAHSSSPQISLLARFFPHYSNAKNCFSFFIIRSEFDVDGIFFFIREFLFFFGCLAP